MNDPKMYKGKPVHKHSSFSSTTDILQPEVLNQHDIQVLEERKSVLPKQCYSQFGCSNCEWVGFIECPYYGLYVDSDSPDIKTRVLPDNRICDKRILWLISNTAQYEIDHKPSYNAWLLDFNRNLGQKLALRELNMLQKHGDILKQRRAELNQDPHNEDLRRQVKVLTSLYQQSYSNFTKVWMRLDQSYTQSVALETPKKVDVRTQKLPTPAEVATLIKKNSQIINAKSRTIKNENESQDNDSDVNNGK